MAELTGWIDYDRPYLAALTPVDRVSYLEKRTRQVALNPLRRILDTEVSPKDEAGDAIQDSSALLIFGVALCCSIESLGKFLSGDIRRRVLNQDRFYGFLHRYMNPEYQTLKIGAETYGEILWKHFRNGLAHGFAVCHGGYEGGHGSPYFVVKGSMLEINPALLLDDLSQGFDRYLADLRTSMPAGALFVAFNAVFEDVYINGN
jgi:hypothetical protein